MSRTAANALFLLCPAVSVVICFSTSQLETFRVPPYRPGPDPSMAGTARDRAADALGPTPGGVADDVAPGSSRSADSVYGSGPDEPAVSRKTSPPVAGPPSGRVRTTVTTTAATRTVATAETRGTDRHQGRPGSPGRPCRRGRPYRRRPEGRTGDPKGCRAMASGPARNARERAGGRSCGAAGGRRLSTHGLLFPT